LLKEIQGKENEIEIEEKELLAEVEKKTKPAAPEQEILG
jgi:hypothetical protein